MLHAASDPRAASDQLMSVIYAAAPRRPTESSSILFGGSWGEL